MAAVEAGAGILDTALSPLAWGASQPATESVVDGAQQWRPGDVLVESDETPTGALGAEVEHRLPPVGEVAVLAVDRNRRSHERVAGRHVGLHQRLRERRLVVERGEELAVEAGGVPLAWTQLGGEAVAASLQLVAEVGREHTLIRVLRPLVDRYDYILVDCQPSLGLLTVNALAAADGVIIPLECEFFSLRGVALLLDTIDKVRERLNFDLELEGILATMYDSRTTHCRQVLQRVVEAFGDKVYQTVITKTVKFPESTVAGTPITTLDPASSGARNYRQLAREVIAAHAQAR